jgi:hypothetical protein
MTRQVEQWYPCAGGLVGGALFLYCQRHFQWQYPQTMPSLFSAIIGVSAIAVGFLGTTQSILVGMDGKETLQRLRESGHLAPIMDYLLVAIHCSFWLAGISALGMLADSASAKWWYMPLCSVWMGFLISSALAYYRIIRLFASILRIGLHPLEVEAPAPKAPTDAIE